MQLGSIALVNGISYLDDLKPRLLSSLVFQWEPHVLVAQLLCLQGGQSKPSAEAASGISGTFVRPARLSELWRWAHYFGHCLQENLLAYMLLSL